MAEENQGEYEERPAVKTDFLIPIDHTKIGQLEYARDLLNRQIPESHHPSISYLRSYFDEYFSHLVANDPLADDKETLTSGYKTGLGVGCFLMSLRFSPYLTRVYKNPLLIPGWIDAIGSSSGKGWFRAGRAWTEADTEVDDYLQGLPELDLGALHYAKSAAGLIIASQNMQYASEIFESLGELQLLPEIDSPIVEQ